MFKKVDTVMEITPTCSPGGRKAVADARANGHPPLQHGSIRLCTSSGTPSNAASNTSMKFQKARPSGLWDCEASPIAFCVMEGRLLFFLASLRQPVYASIRFKNLRALM